MSRNRRYSRNAKNRTMDRIIDQEERLFEEDEERFLTDDEDLVTIFLTIPREELEKCIPTQVRY